MELDEAFASKKQIAESVGEQLEVVMKDYGYEILNTLVTDLSPDARVKASMNEINASKRLKEAASHKAEADKVQQVKAAEADAEARYLSGLGVARQRKAIVTGLQASISEFESDVDGVTSKDVMDILVLTQYFDTLTAVGANNLILEHEPASVASLQNQVNKTLKNRKTGFLSWKEWALRCVLVLLLGVIISFSKSLCVEKSFVEVVDLRLDIHFVTSACVINTYYSSFVLQICVEYLSFLTWNEKKNIQIMLILGRQSKRIEIYQVLHLKATMLEFQIKRKHHENWDPLSSQSKTTLWPKKFQAVS